MKKYIIGALALSLVGCSQLATVNDNTPHTTFSAVVGGQTLSFESPKDYSVEGLSISVSGTNLSMTIASLHSQQNTNAIAETAQVVTAEGAANVNTINAVSTAIQLVTSSTAKAMAK